MQHGKRGSELASHTHEHSAMLATSYRILFPPLSRGGGLGLIPPSPSIISRWGSAQRCGCREEAGLNGDNFEPKTASSLVRSLTDIFPPTPTLLLRVSWFFFWFSLAFLTCIWKSDFVRGREECREKKSSNDFLKVWSLYRRHGLVSLSDEWVKSRVEMLTGRYVTWDRNAAKYVHWSMSALQSHFTYWYSFTTRTVAEMLRICRTATIS